MRRSPRRISTQTTRRIVEGRGQGSGPEYRPWLTVHDFPSRGRVHRIKGWKHGRVHHLLSDLEANFFYTFEWSSSIVDIREQYPLLPVEETITIADSLGIKHPVVPHTREPVVMTTDFLLTKRCGSEIRYKALAAKYSAGLTNKRTLEKLKIEESYWNSRNIEWGLGTERELPLELAENVRWVHPYFRSAELYPLNERRITEIAASLTQAITKNNSPLRDITQSFDVELRLVRGTCLSIVRHLVANRTWKVDMSQLIRQSAPLVVLNITKRLMRHERRIF